MIPHRHPSLRRPISEDQFLREFVAVWDRVPVRLARGRTPTVTIGDEDGPGPGPLDLVHARNCRRYAEVDVPRRHFFFAQAALWLPAPQRRGLVGHEVGHVLTPGGSERDADEASRAILGVVVSYSRAWPGKGLQTTRARR